MFVSAPSTIPSPSVSTSCAERGVEIAMEIANKKVVRLWRIEMFFVRVVDCLLLTNGCRQLAISEWLGCQLLGEFRHKK